MFRRPKVGDVVTVSIRYRGTLLGQEWDDRTYENVPVVENDPWTKPDEFCIEGGHLPWMTKRTINLSRVTSLVINGRKGDVAANSNIEFVHVKGSKGNIYSVTKVNGVAKECTCPGYTFRKHCRHIDAENKVLETA